MLSLQCWILIKPNQYYDNHVKTISYQVIWEKLTTFFFICDVDLLNIILIFFLKNSDFFLVSTAWIRMRRRVIWRLICIPSCLHMLWFAGYGSTQVVIVFGSYVRNASTYSAISNAQEFLMVSCHRVDIVSVLVEHLWTKETIQYLSQIVNMLSNVFCNILNLHLRKSKYFNVSQVSLCLQSLILALVFLSRPWHDVLQ